MANKLTARWTPDLVEAGVAFLRGSGGDGPFGRLEDGFVDLCGLPIKDAFRPDGVVLSQCDFTRLQAERMVIFADSKLTHCRFDDARLEWGDFHSTFEEVSFRRAKMVGSSFGSPYLRCDFSKADISGSTGLTPTFTNCLFDRTKFKNSVLRNCTFNDCKLSGEVRGVIFGGEFGVMEGCDLTEASFVDCTFNNFSFENCTTSDDTLIFRDWQITLRLFAEQLDRESDAEVVQVGRRWLSVWHDRLSITRNYLVDLADLIHFEGPKVGAELFRIYRTCRS